MTASPPCRFCGAPLDFTVLDLGAQPLSNAFLGPEDDAAAERRYPLHVRLCEACFLAQADEAVPPDAIFRDYAYFSSYSRGWLEHARLFSDAMIERLRLGPQSRVVEVASNDGYLLRNFVARGIPCLGIEPAENVAMVARAAGVPTRSLFLDEASGQDLADEGWRADLVIGNNVLAHVPRIGGFAAGLAALLKREGGTLSVEFPHLVRLIDEVQFDTIYHEHFSYLSLTAVERIFASAGLRVFEVERLATHGGSLRVLAERADAPVPRPAGPGLLDVRAEEQRAGVTNRRYYEGFAARAHHAVASVRGFLATAKAEGKQVAAYGAAAKGNTLLNACGVSAADIAYAVDRSPYKQGKRLPGTHIPVSSPDRLAETRPDYVLILPWNLRDEIVAQMSHVRDWGGRFATPIPELRILP